MAKQQGFFGKLFGTAKKQVARVRGKYNNVKRELGYKKDKLTRRIANVRDKLRYGQDYFFLNGLMTDEDAEYALDAINDKLPGHTLTRKEKDVYYNRYSKGLARQDLESMLRRNGVDVNDPKIIAQRAKIEEALAMAKNARTEAEYRKYVAKAQKLIDKYDKKHPIEKRLYQAVHTPMTVNGRYVTMYSHNDKGEFDYKNPHNALLAQRAYMGEMVDNRRKGWRLPDWNNKR